MQLTIDIKENALDKVMYLLKSLKSDVKIVDANPLDIDIISIYDKDYKYIIEGRDEREANPQNYGTMDDIKWD